MSEEANRSGGNLILMCLEHATEIDETPEHFPVELLRTWKHVQLAERKEMQRAWELTEAEIKEVIQASFGRACGVRRRHHRCLVRGRGGPRCRNL
jgi:hypothetical protein